MHDEDRAKVLEAIEKRKREGISGDWVPDVRHALTEALAANDDLDVVHEKVHAAVKALLRPPKDPGEYKDDPALDGIEIRVRALSKSDHATLHAELAEAEGEFTASNAPRSHEWRKSAARTELLRRLVPQVITGVRAQLEDGDLSWESVDGKPMPIDVIDALDTAGLLWVLWYVGDAHQRLSPLPRRGFGLPHPSTSPNASAETVPLTSAPSSGAPATPTDRSSAEATLRPAPALDVKSSAVLGSAPHSSFIAPAAESRGSEPSI